MLTYMFKHSAYLQVLLWPLFTPSLVQSVNPIQQDLHNNEHGYEKAHTRRIGGYNCKRSSVFELSFSRDLVSLLLLICRGRLSVKLSWESFSTP